MKKVIIGLSVLIFLTSCGGGITWADYEATCVKTNTILSSAENAKKQCACETEKYKAAGLIPTDMSDMAKVNSVVVTDCIEE